MGRRLPLKLEGPAGSVHRPEGRQQQEGGYCAAPSRGGPVSPLASPQSHANRSVPLT